MQQDYLRIKERVFAYGLYNCSFSLLNFIFSLILVVTFQQNWMGRVNAQILCVLIFGIISFLFFLNNDLFRIDYNKNNYCQILAWGIPLIPHAVSGWIRQGLDRYIINYFYSTFEVGIFSFALNLANVIIMIGSAFNSTNSVTIFQVLSSDKLTKDQKREKLRKQTRVIFLINMIATIVVLILITILAYFAFPKYCESIPFMWLLSINGFGNCVYFLYCNYLFYYNKTRLLMCITFGTSTLHLFLSFLFTRYSLYYTAIVYGLVMIIMVILVFEQAHKLLKKNLI